MKWIALMPLRGGSKSIPNKNTRRIAGRPLYEWSLEQAINSKCFDAIYVASDSQSIRNIVLEQFSDSVIVVDRSAASATDVAASEIIMLEVGRQVAFDVMCLIQATSPLTRSDDFIKAKDKFISGSYDSLLSAVLFNRFLWDADEKPVNYDPTRRPRRQEAAVQYMENGAFYFTAAEVLEKQKCRLGGRIGIHVMPLDTACEIDEPRDWTFCERLLLDRSDTQLQHVLSKIDTLVVDVDGTLTDGGMYYGANGEALKKFHTRDGKGLQLLAEQGVRICVVSSEDSPAMAARIKKLGISDYYPGIQNKLELLLEKIASWNTVLERICVIGDDLGDLDLIKHVGFSFCPADAVSEVSVHVDYICRASGGTGAVREACDLICAAKMDRKSKSDDASGILVGD
ncbi:MAG TPA: phosphatase [Gammaproteobacteria bacterium]|nr:phosphatase [Gammaproteobacteria bacterium]|tara:strand:- start:5822 stop:7018 length:1197 start_codon:yes stop_codon:yes gene_type:complete